MEKELKIKSCNRYLTESMINIQKQIQKNLETQMLEIYKAYTSTTTVEKNDVSNKSLNISENTIVEKSNYDDFDISDIKIRQKDKDTDETTQLLIIIDD